MCAFPTVFVVDDDLAVRDSLAWLLGSPNVEVRTFGSAEAFLAAYDPAARGCLIVDVRMPGMSGLELQRMLRACRSTLRVIVITGHADAATAEQAVQAGACAFLEKPFDDRVLLERVQRCLSDAAPPPATARGERR